MSSEKEQIRQGLLETSSKNRKLTKAIEDNTDGMWCISKSCLTTSPAWVMCLVAKTSARSKTGVVSLTKSVRSSSSIGYLPTTLFNNDTWKTDEFEPTQVIEPYMPPCLCVQQFGIVHSNEGQVRNRCAPWQFAAHEVSVSEKPNLLPQKSGLFFCCQPEISFYFGLGGDDAAADVRLNRNQSTPIALPPLWSRQWGNEWALEVGGHTLPQKGWSS